MPKDYNLDDILNEYSGKSKEYSAKNKTKVASSASGSSGSSYQDTGFIKIPESVKNADITIAYDRKELKAAESETEKRPAPSHQYSKFAVSDINRPNVSYINSVKEVSANKADLPPRPTDAIDGYDGAVVTRQSSDEEYVPKVRKMSNSTRAKEMRAKRRKKKKKNQPEFTYPIESPDGIYTRPEKKKRKFVVKREEENKNPEEENKNDMVELSSEIDPEELDVKIADNSADDSIFEENKSDKKKKRKNKAYNKNQSIKDYDSFENAREIKHDIADIRSNISFRIIVLTVMAVVSIYLAVAEGLKLPVPDMLSINHSPEIYSWVQLIILLLSAAVSFGTVKNGVISLLTFRADSDSFAALTTIASAVSAAVITQAPQMLQSKKVFIYVPVAVASLLINAIGKRLILNRAALNFDFISKDFNRHAIVCVENDDRAESLTRGTIGDFPILVTMKKTNFIKDFAKYTYSVDTGDKYSRFTAPAVFIFSLLFSVAMTFWKMRTLSLESVCFGFFVFTLCVCACSCIAIPLIANIPLEKAAKKYVRNHGVMLGYQSVDDYYDTNSVMIDASTLFPTGTINLCSIKLFSGTKIDEALIEAASLASHGNSILKELFCDIIADKNKLLNKVENFVYEDSMGLCGWINNRRILLGNRELMNSHNIEGIPTKTKESEFTEGNRDALYLSVSGNLAAMFIIEVSASTAVKKCMKQLEKKDIAVIIKSVDPFITINRLSALFNFSDELLKIIPQRMVKDFNEETRKVKKISASMACSGKFTSFVQLIMGTKSIRKTVAAGVAIQSASVLLGIIIVVLNCIMGAVSELSASMVLAYNAICTIITVLAVKIRKI
ncbi:hypothetical protein [Porcipelethomonas sp.]|uniref:hypothetical protein n=1 Tax=Porcipelethomonas sp. TaxID=2981675 RepID=UPI003EF62872